MFTKKDVTVSGTVDKGFESVRELFERQFKNGEELSAQVCVYHKGEKVTDSFNDKIVIQLAAYLPTGG